MKWLLLLLSFNCFAQQEFNISYSRINQDLEFEKPIRLPMDAIQLSYTYWTDYGLGLRVAVARTSKTENSVNLDKKYTNKINALWKGHITYKYGLSGDLSIISGVGITEYHSTWWVDGIEPAWSKGTDSHRPSWFIGTQYRLVKDMFLEFNYSYEYKKFKKGYGEEKTDSYSIGFTYNF